MDERPTSDQIQGKFERIVKHRKPMNLREDFKGRLCKESRRLIHRFCVFLTYNFLRYDCEHDLRPKFSNSTGSCPVCPVPLCAVSRCSRYTRRNINYNSPADTPLLFDWRVNAGDDKSTCWQLNDANISMISDQMRVAHTDGVNYYRHFSLLPIQRSTVSRSSSWFGRDSMAAYIFQRNLSSQPETCDYVLIKYSWYRWLFIILLSQ